MELSQSFLKKIKKELYPAAKLLGLRPPFRISKSVQGLGELRKLQVDSSGVLRILGNAETPPSLESLTLVTNLGTFLPSHWYWIPGTQFSSFVIEFHVSAGALTLLELNYQGQTLFQKKTKILLDKPHYASLREKKDPLGRDTIYSYGPPSDEIPPELFEFLTQFKSPHLDFGCGKGALVKELRARGIEAMGIEINRPEIANALTEEMRPFLELYDGTLPLPFKDEAFETVSAIEVLEHITEYRTVISELARVTKHLLLITVPDISAIPLLHKHSVVPWHLLESTHFNFFTQTSLFQTLAPYFKKITFSRTCPNTINSTVYWTSLVAICKK